MEAVGFTHITFIKTFLVVFYLRVVLKLIFIFFSFSCEGCNTFCSDLQIVLSPTTSTTSLGGC